MITNAMGPQSSSPRSTWATGNILHDCMPRHRRYEFLRFLRKIERSVPEELDIHIILDNYSSHKHADVQRWLEKHPRVMFHFVPTSASWLNLVERFFAELSQRNQDPKPFVWTASVKSILAKVARGNETLASQH